jgi:hypothetical protein
VYQWLVTANVPSSPILFTLMLEAIYSSKTSVLTTATLRNIAEDSILQLILLGVNYEWYRLTGRAYNFFILLPANRIFRRKAP